MQVPGKNSEADDVVKINQSVIAKNVSLLSEDCGSKNFEVRHLFLIYFPIYFLFIPFLKNKYLLAFYLVLGQVLGQKKHMKMNIDPCPSGVHLVGGHSQVMCQQKYWMRTEGRVTNCPGDLAKVNSERGLHG